MSVLVVDPVGQPAARPSPAPAQLRFVRVRADLLPAEIVAARQVDALRSRVLVGLAALMTALVLGIGFSWWQTHAADDSLASAQRQNRQLQAQTTSFAPLVSAQSGTTAISGQLATLMTGDLPWRAMLDSVRAAAPQGVALTQVTATMTDASAGGTQPVTGTVGTGSTVGSASTVGTIALVGTAHTKAQVADFADRLARVRGLAAPLPTSVSTTGAVTTFDITVDVTQAALGGRWTPRGGTAVPASAVPAAGVSNGGN